MDTGRTESDKGQSMSTESQILQHIEVLGGKIDTVSAEVGEMKVDMAGFIGRAEGCQTMCKRTHDAVFGNGKRGLKTQVAVIVGVIGALTVLTNIAIALVPK